MRPVLHQDLVALARCMLMLPKNTRRRFSERTVAKAFLADAARRSSGKAHPLFGDGTLQSACGTNPMARERFLDDPDYADCLVTALQVVSDARIRHSVHS